VDRSRLADNLTQLTGLPDPDFDCIRLRQDASARAYYRVTLEPPAEPRSLVLMDLGPEAGRRPDEVTGGPEPDELPFVNVQRYLAAGDLPVPRLYRHDEEAGLLLLEDFGDRTLEEAVPGASRATRRELYDRAVAQLVQLQQYTATGGNDDCIAFQRAFDRSLLRWELDHFREWILDERNVALTSGERQILDRDFDRLARQLADMPRLFVHRDFQSRNLMLLDSGERLGILDFQDALLGPRPYDLVALLRDSYVVLTDEEVQRLIGLYETLAVEAGLGIEQDRFEHEFALVTLQRKLKDSGRFVFIDREKRNGSFLRFVPDSLGYVSWALRRLPEYEALGAVLTARVEELVA